MKMNDNQLESSIYEFKRLIEKEKELSDIKMKYLTNDECDDSEYLRLSIELKAVEKQKNDLSNAISQEFKRRKKEDKSGFALIFSFIAFVALLIVFIIRWAKTSEFPVALGCITICIFVLLVVSIYLFNKYTK